MSFRWLFVRLLQSRNSSEVDLFLFENLRLYYSLISREVEKSKYDKSREILRNLKIFQDILRFLKIFQSFSRYFKISQEISRRKMWQFSFLEISYLGMFREIPDPRFLLLITTLSPLDLKMFHRAWRIVSSFRKNAMTLLWRCQKITKVFASKELMFECW